MLQAHNRLRAMVGPAQGFPANASPPDRRPRIEGVICWSRIRAVASMPEIRDRASAANRLNGQNRSEAVLFPSTDNPPGEDIGKRCATLRGSSLKVAIAYLS